jgi:hypothetical protein
MEIERLKRQVEIVSIEELVADRHVYRKFLKLLGFESINIGISKLRKNNPYGGYGMCTLFKCLFPQHLEDLSDRDWKNISRRRLAISR